MAGTLQPDGVVLQLLMGASLALLFAGFLMRDRRRHAVRIAGWLGFAAYWPFQSEHYFAIGDPFNGWLTLIGPLAIVYIAYHELLNLRWEEDPPALKWLAGTTAIAAATFFLFTWWPAIAVATQYWTSVQTEWLLEILFGVDAYTQVQTDGSGERFVNLYLTDYPTQPYAVTIILACTAIQSMMIFVGAILTLRDADMRRKLQALAITVPIIHVLNLFRNAGIVYGYKILEWNPFQWGAAQPGGWRGMFWMDMGNVGLAQGSFEWMHSWVGKWGSLGALILIALAVFSILPELHGHILDLFDLPKRRRAGFFREPPEPPVAAATEA